MKEDTKPRMWGTGMERGFTLSSGRFIDPNELIIGIDPSLRVFEGYDSHMPDVWPDPDADDEERAAAFTPEERAELADFMIALWQRFKEARAPEEVINHG